MTFRALFYSQHLLGIGHLVRTLRIAEGLASSGFDVTLILGGLPVSGLGSGGARIVQLPPLKAASGGLGSLLTPDGTAPDAAYLAQRQELLLSTLRETRPDVVLIEAFPFGRRALRFELLPLIAAAQQSDPKPLIVSSIRDILQANPKADRRRETVSTIMQHFDAVLVHGDPDFARLDETFPEAAELDRKVQYTGFVGPRTITPRSGEPYDVVVMAGGGAVGYDLLQTALQAKPRTRLASARWLCVTGPQMPAAHRIALEQLGAASDVEVATFLANPPSAFCRAQLAIGQAGYNSVAELLATRCRSVLVPYADGGETEQTVRASRLAQRRLAVMLAPGELSVDAMAHAVNAALALPDLPPPPPFDGAERSARIIGDLIRARSA